MIECTYEAVYSVGETYEVEWDETDARTYLVATSGALMPVPYYLNGASFVEFRCVSFVGLTDGAFWEQDTLMRKRLRAPIKPASPPPVQQTNESSIPKFHVERIPGESSFAYLQRIAAEQDAYNKRIRGQERRETITNLTPSHRKVAEANFAVAAGAQSLRDKKPARQ